MKKSSLSKKLTSAPYLVWAAIFIIVPLIFVAYYSLTDVNGSFSLQYIADIGKYKDIMLNSIWLGFIATVISLVMAYPLAYIMARSKANVQRTMMMLVMLPMWMNLLIRTYSMMILMQDTGIINNALEFLGLSPVHMINTQGAVVLGMVYNYIPYMILPLYSIMAKLDYSLVEAAQDLGANKLTVIKEVVIPHSLPGIASGFTMVFVPSVSTFYISKKLGGNTFSLIGDIIEMQFKSANNYNLGAALSMVLMVLIIICMMVMNQFTGDDDDGGVLI
ncbi:MAG: ABC transporter permease [Clostridia bacterium]|nr:ABC transporter permease [Clostridia bacterium]MBR2079616.1 ABC transporter permease [Clostridia bacterium]MBR2417672.1 ABC transporter permease [Clostridia bacterium]